MIERFLDSAGGAIAMIGSVLYLRLSRAILIPLVSDLGKGRVRILLTRCRCVSNKAPSIACLSI